jgi:PIN domain nuclease of toxin-antitoxin system
MNNVVLDASAILALIFREPGAERLTDEIPEQVWRNLKVGIPIHVIR